MKIVRLLAFLTIISSPWVSKAQSVPVPAQIQSQPILITNATAHLGNGQVIENSYIAFENGKITFVGNMAVGRGFPGHLVIDATGKHLYPGFIAPDTELGLQEIEAVRATADASEIGSLNPNIRSIIAYNTDSEVTPTVRSMGVLMAEITPTGGRIPGQSSIVKLDAWNWQDAAYSTDFAMHLVWPNASKWNWQENRNERNEEYASQLRELEDFFQQARAYSENPAATKNLKMEAMKGVFDGSKKLFIHTNAATGMQEAVLFATHFQLKPTIVGAKEAWLITSFLKAHDVSVIYSTTQQLPSREDDDIDQPFKTPKILQDAGIKWCFAHDGFWKQRNLAFQAGQAVGFGLAYEDAVKALTGSTAEILGIGKTVGTIEVGKDATLFISEGDALDMRTNKVTSAFIQGRKLDLDNKQEALYRRFQMKYKSR
ncbi:MAG: amidohydrolase family protein [Saprospiraceae bacterium]|nr:amidohydrolase family protein [Saprospiraceae bacterium]